MLSEFHQVDFACGRIRIFCGPEKQKCIIRPWHAREFANSMMVANKRQRERRWRRVASPGWTLQERLLALPSVFSETGIKNISVYGIG